MSIWRKKKRCILSHDDVDANIEDAFASANTRRLTKWLFILRESFCPLRLFLSVGGFSLDSATRVPFTVVSVALKLHSDIAGRKPTHSSLSLSLPTPTFYLLSAVNSGRPQYPAKLSVRSSTAVRIRCVKRVSPSWPASHSSKRRLVFEGVSLIIAASSFRTFSREFRLSSRHF